MSTPAKGRSIRFRGRNFLALVVAPDPPLGTWLVDLDDWLSRAPAFFKGRPVVLDLSAMHMDRSQIPTIVTELGRRGIKVMGVDGADVEWLGIGVPPDLVGGKGDPAPDFQLATQPQYSTQDAAQVPRQVVAAPEGAPSSLVVDEALRSGRSVYFPTGDVTIIGAVQSGAEVIAGGTITVHGALRGRAIAGVAGNAKARIFCRRFEAELLAIDGIYRASESVDPALWTKPVQARLDGESLKVEAME
ncbi:MAG: septum site-determining protein MinC [Alsobacter sp.]